MGKQPPSGLVPALSRRRARTDRALCRATPPGDECAHHGIQQLPHPVSVDLWWRCVSSHDCRRRGEEYPVWSKVDRPMGTEQTAKLCQIRLQTAAQKFSERNFDTCNTWQLPTNPIFDLLYEVYVLPCLVIEVCVLIVLRHLTTAFVLLHLVQIWGVMNSFATWCF